MPLRAAASASNKLPFSQLWTEEEEYLWRSSARLAPGSVIVEIGTAQGGSAYLFARASRGEAHVYSYDIAPSTEAYRNLRNLGVHIVARASTDGAAAWKSTCGEPVDLLFIDGSHTLASVYQDFTSWLPHLKPGARVLFHDYDPPERGGASHLGVRVFLDGLLDDGALTHVDHVGRILSGIVRNPRAAVPENRVFFRAWEKIGRKARRFCGGNYRRWKVLAGKRPPAFLQLLSHLLELKSGRWLSRLKASSGPRPLLIAERPLSSEARALVNAGASDVELVDDMTFGLLLWDRLRTRRNDLLNLSLDRRSFFKWEEHLEMLAHATGAPPTLEEAFTAPRSRSLEDLSRACATEHVRHAVLWRLLESLAG